MGKQLRNLLLAISLLALTAGLTAYLGLIEVGADRPHWAPVSAVLTFARDRAIARRARDIAIPPLDDEALIRAGAGNYNAMCVGCHLAPGVAATELSRGLYPAPPPFADTGISDPAAAFWVIKHGIMSTGMPAWGKSMDDPYIWGMVALLRQLPSLDADQYRALVASSGGHQHGGGETALHHDEQTPLLDEPASHHDHNADDDHHAAHDEHPADSAQEEKKKEQAHTHPHDEDAPHHEH